MSKAVISYLTFREMYGSGSHGGYCKTLLNQITVCPILTKVRAQPSPVAIDCRHCKQSVILAVCRSLGLVSKTIRYSVIPNRGRSTQN